MLHIEDTGEQSEKQMTTNISPRIECKSGILLRFPHRKPGTVRPLAYHGLDDRNVNKTLHWVRGFSRIGCTEKKSIADDRTWDKILHPTGSGFDIPCRQHVPPLKRQLHHLQAAFG